MTVTVHEKNRCSVYRISSHSPIYSQELEKSLIWILNREEVIGPCQAIVIIYKNSLLYTIWPRNNRFLLLMTACLTPILFSVHLFLPVNGYAGGVSGPVHE